MSVVRYVIPSRVPLRLRVDGAANGFIEGTAASVGVAASFNGASATHFVPSILYSQQ